MCSTFSLEELASNEIYFLIDEAFRIVFVLPTPPSLRAFSISISIFFSKIHPHQPFTFHLKHKTNCNRLNFPLNFISIKDIIPFASRPPSRRSLLGLPFVVVRAICYSYAYYRSLTSISEREAKSKQAENVINLQLRRRRITFNYLLSCTSATAQTCFSRFEELFHRLREGGEGRLMKGD